MNVRTGYGWRGRTLFTTFGQRSAELQVNTTHMTYILCFELHAQGGYVNVYLNAFTHARQRPVRRTATGLFGKASRYVIVRFGVGQRLRLDPGYERFTHRVYEPAASPRNGTVPAFRWRRRRTRRFRQLGAQATRTAPAAIAVVPQKVLSLVFQLLAQRVQQRRSGSQLHTSNGLVTAHMKTMMTTGRHHREKDLPPTWRICAPCSTRSLR